MSIYMYMGALVIFLSSVTALLLSVHQFARKDFCGLDNIVTQEKPGKSRFETSQAARDVLGEKLSDLIKLYFFYNYVRIRGQIKHCCFICPPELISGSCATKSHVFWGPDIFLQSRCSWLYAPKIPSTRYGYIFHLRPSYDFPFERRVLNPLTIILFN